MEQEKRMMEKERQGDSNNSLPIEIVKRSTPRVWKGTPQGKNTKADKLTQGRPKKSKAVGHNVCH